jgi:hypothetical protein
MVRRALDRSSHSSSQRDPQAPNQRECLEPKIDGCELENVASQEAVVPGSPSGLCNRRPSYLQNKTQCAPSCTTPSGFASALRVDTRDESQDSNVVGSRAAARDRHHESRNRCSRSRRARHGPLALCIKPAIASNVVSASQKSPWRAKIEPRSPRGSCEPLRVVASAHARCRSVMPEQRRRSSPTPGRRCHSADLSQGAATSEACVRPTSRLPISALRSRTGATSRLTPRRLRSSPPPTGRSSD